jgi:hypothetical protein
MKLNKHILFVIVSTVLILSACQKENSDIFLPYNGPGAGADTNWFTNIDPSMPVSLLKSDLTMSTYTDSIEINNNATELIASSGLQCLFQANCLTDSGNETIRGKIMMQSILMQKKGDMIRQNKPTTSNGYVISSAGMFFIKLKKDGSPLKLASHSKLNILYRDTPNIPLIKLFYGADASQGVLNWYMNNDPANNIMPFNEGYQVNTNRLDWINAGYVIDSNTSQNISINITLAKHFTNANTVAWLVFKDYRSVISLKGDAVSRKFSCNDIPSGKEATIIVISRQVNDYYMGSKNITTFATGGASLSVAVAPVKTSLDALLQYLNSL